MAKEEVKKTEEKVAPKEEKNVARKKEEPKILEVVNSESKLNLKTKTGRSVMWTLEEALQEHNFKQLTEKTKACLKGRGKSSHVILRELGK